MLYICATPIGNLEDITLRVLRVLRQVDLILAEDTRHTRKLLNHFEIEKPIISLHQHNENVKSEEVVGWLLAGKEIALVSDAGTPGISDPGGVLINKAREAGIQITMLPGANAVITALVLSGLPMEPFYFAGFLPRKRGEKISRLDNISKLEATILFYEAPHRLLDTLKSIGEVFGERKVVVCRELTKRFEEVIEGNIKEHLEYFTQNAPRGEFVLVVSGYAAQETPIKVEELDLKELVRMEMKTAGITKKQAVKVIAKRYKLPKNAVYQETLELPTELSL